MARNEHLAILQRIPRPTRKPIIFIRAKFENKQAFLLRWHPLLGRVQPSKAKYTTQMLRLFVLVTF
jgi:hypothetical protein